MAQAALGKWFFLQVVCFVVIILVILFSLNIQKEAFSVAEGADFAGSGLPVKYGLSPFIQLHSVYLNTSQSSAV